MATTLPLVAPLNAFPFCSPQGPLQANCAKSSKPPIFCFSHLCLQVNLPQRYKNKRYREIDTFLLRSLAEEEGFEPPDPRRSSVFKTAAIDHSAIPPDVWCKSTFYFLNSQISPPFSAGEPSSPLDFAGRWDYCTRLRLFVFPVACRGARPNNPARSCEQLLLFFSPALHK